MCMNGGDLKCAYISPSFVTSEMNNLNILDRDILNIDVYLVD